MAPARRAGVGTQEMEFAIAGEVGPVLRSALRPLMVLRATPQTVLRLDAASFVAVLSLMEALDCATSRVTSIRCLPGGIGLPAPWGLRT